MADYRLVHMKVWDREWFSALDSDGKVLWFYLITNHRTSVSGIYQILPRSILVETGIRQAKVTTLLQSFETADKIMYADGVMWVRKMREYQAIGSWKVQECARKDVVNIPTGAVKSAYMIAYPKAMDTVPIPPPTKKDRVSIPPPSESDTFPSESEALAEAGSLPKGAGAAFEPPPPGIEKWRAQANGNGGHQ